ncbi:MAG: hypothetical protein O2894_00560 [Planctomycetota bacterium]|nr:hypothetical protein [Planctomycetota bacterium]
MPFGAWGLASAAALLLALGAAVTLELTETPGSASAPISADLRPLAGDYSITEDATLALYHGVETFDEVGLAPGELIADWGR